MALLSYYMASSNCTARAWIMVGQALRIAIDLGFHRDLSHLNLSFFEISMRRHVFWNIYILDRLLSISLGRPLGKLRMHREQSSLRLCSTQSFNLTLTLLFSPYRYRRRQHRCALTSTRTSASIPTALWFCFDRLSSSSYWYHLSYCKSSRTSSSQRKRGGSRSTS